MRALAPVMAGVSLLVLIAAGCDQEAPSRQHIPVLRKALQNIERGVAQRNRAAIDSLLAVGILEYEQGSDSLLSLVYGADNDFAFERFELGEITYTGDKARIDCFIMDSTHQRNRPLVFTLTYDHDLWLFKRFELLADSTQQ